MKRLNTRPLLLALAALAVILMACAPLGFLSTPAAPSAAPAAQEQPAIDIAATMAALEGQVKALQDAQAAAQPKEIGAPAIEAGAAATCVVVPTCVPPTALPPTPTAVRPSPTRTALPPTPTPLPPTPTAILPTPKPGTLCDWVKFVADKTVPDGTVFQSNAQFTKIWTLKNNGSCTWSTNYKLVFDSGNQMGGASEVNLPRAVRPGETVDIAINLTAPKLPATYTGYWKLKNAKGKTFGWGPNANRVIYVQINVVEESDPGTMPAFNFAAPTFCQGSSWSSSKGSIGCPGALDTENGAVSRVEEVTLEGGVTKSIQSLIMTPNSGSGGAVSGIFPPYQVYDNDKFSARIGCLNEHTGCDVSFKLSYIDSAGKTHVLMGPVGDTHDRYSADVDVDLTPLVGQTVRFVLTVMNNGDSTDDYAVWVNPTIWR